MKNSQIAIIIAIAVLIGFTLVNLGNSATYSSFADASLKHEETTTVIGYLNLEEPMSFDPKTCLLYTSPSPRDGLLSRMPSSA